MADLPLGQSFSYFGITCWDEGTTEHWVRFGKSEATRTIVCGWQDRIPLIKNLFGATGINSNNQYAFNPVASYPDAPGTLFFDGVEVEGIPGDTGMNVGEFGMVGYKYARLHITFATMPYDNDNLNIISLNYGIEEISLPNDGVTPCYYYNGNTSTPVDSAGIPSLKLPIVTLTFQQFNQPTLPIQQVTNLAGYVNANALNFYPPGIIGVANPWKPAAETVLFSGASNNRRMTVSGQANHDMTYQFVYNPLGWNKKFQPGVGFTEVKDANGNPPFPTGDFSPLGIFASNGLI